MVLCSAFDEHPSYFVCISFWAVCAFHFPTSFLPLLTFERLSYVARILVLCDRNHKYHFFFVGLLMVLSGMFRVCVSTQTYLSMCSFVSPGVCVMVNKDVPTLHRDYTVMPNEVLTSEKAVHEGKDCLAGYRHPCVLQVPSSSIGGSEAPLSWTLKCKI